MWRGDVSRGDDVSGFLGTGVSPHTRSPTNGQQFAKYLHDHQRGVDGPGKPTDLHQPRQQEVQRPVRHRRREDRLHGQRAEAGALHRHDWPEPERRGLLRVVGPRHAGHAVPRRHAVLDFGPAAVAGRVQLARHQAGGGCDREQGGPRRSDDGCSVDRQCRRHAGHRAGFAQAVPRCRRRAGLRGCAA